MSSGVLIDPINAIQAELGADSDILAIVRANPTQATSRVYAETFPPDPVMSNVATYQRFIAPAIVLVGAPGTAFENGLGSVPRFELRAYSPRTSDARDLCYLAMNAINERTIRRDGVMCYVSFALDMGGTLPTRNIDPDTGTPFYYCFFAATTYAGVRS